MKKGSKFLIAFIAAALTFGGLMAFVGPQQSGWNRYGYHGWRHHYYHGHYHDHHDNLPGDTNEKSL